MSSAGYLHSLTVDQTERSRVAKRRSQHIARFASDVAARAPHLCAVEATAPVKLPSSRCPGTGSRCTVRTELYEGWYFNGGSTPPARGASQPPTYSTHRRAQSNDSLQ